MTYLITPSELKTNGFVNANMEEEYLMTAIEEAQDIYLREVLGDSLYVALQNHETQNPPDIYDEIMDNHVKYFLKYKVVALLCMTVNFKVRNIGIAQQYGTDVNTTTMEDTQSVMAYYNGQADFYLNRLSKFLQKNANNIPEYKCQCNQITNPNPVHPICSIYLG